MTDQNSLSPFRSYSDEYDPLFAARVSGQIVFLCRLNPEGYLSTNAFIGESDETTFDLSSLSLEYVGPQPRNAQIQDSNPNPAYVAALKTKRDVERQRVRNEELLREVENFTNMSLKRNLQTESTDSD
jgi:hypothetical protein